MSVYCLKHEAIQKPISENNIGAPSAPQKGKRNSSDTVLGRICRNARASPTQANTT